MTKSALRQPVRETAGTGREAIGKAQGRFLNLTLLDIRLPTSRQEKR
jgi:phosphopantetheinyl transferase